MILEIRSYILKVGAMPQALARFTESLPARTKVSPIAVGPRRNFSSVFRYRSGGAGSCESRTAARYPPM